MKTLRGKMIAGVILAGALIFGIVSLHRTISHQSKQASVEKSTEADAGGNDEAARGEKGDVILEDGIEIAPVQSDASEDLEASAGMWCSYGLPSQAAKGDDGCYYFRYETMQGKEQLVFYKDHGTVFLKTAMSEEFSQKGFHIKAFTKCGEYIFLYLYRLDDGDEYHYRYAWIEADSGQWVHTAKAEAYDRSVVYGSSIYAYDLNEIYRYNIGSEKKDLILSENFETKIEMIRGNVMYYSIFLSEKQAALKQYHMDSRKTSTLFRYSIDDSVASMRTGCLQADDQYFYLWVQNPDKAHAVYEIPLNGGWVKEIISKAYWLDMDDTHLYYLTDSFEIHSISKTSGEEKTLAAIHDSGTGNAPFLCAGDGDHLLVADYKKKDQKIIRKRCYSDDEWRDEETYSTFIYDYLWMDTEGKEEDVIKGVPVSKTIG